MSNKAKNSKESILCDVKELMKLYDRDDRTLRILHNYTFLAPRPRWREIFTTEFGGRMIDTEVCEVVIPEADKILSPFTFNNRKGMGSHILPNRIHLNNKTFDNAVRSIEKMNDSRYKNIDTMMSVFNSYSGQLKNRTDYKRLLELRDKLSPEWWQWLEWDGKRKCIIYKQGYSPNERLNNKYNLKLKKL